MTEYQKPEFVEVRMDAEIGSYQADPLDPPFTAPDEETSSREE